MLKLLCLGLLLCNGDHVFGASTTKWSPSGTKWPPSGSTTKWPPSGREVVPKDVPLKTSETTTETMTRHQGELHNKEYLRTQKNFNTSETFDMEEIERISEKNKENQIQQPKPIVSYKLFRKISFWSRDVLNNIIGIAGCICNCLMIFVLATIDDSTERSVKIYFIFLAIFDNCFILSRLCMNAFSHMWSYVDAEFGSYWYATLYPYVNAFGVRLFTALSIWTVVVICLQRLLVILIPMSVRDNVFTKRPYLIMTCLTVILSGLMALNLFRWERVSVINPFLNLTEYRESSAQFDAGREEAMRIWNIVEHVIGSGLPMVLIFLLVIVIIIKIKMIQKERKRLTHQNSGPILSRPELRLTRTSIAVAIFSFFSLFPLKLLPLIFQTMPHVFLPVNRLLYVTLIFCFAPLHMLNSASNFVIFILSNPAFRAHLVSKFSCT